MYYKLFSDNSFTISYSNDSNPPICYFCWFLILSHGFCSFELWIHFWLTPPHTLFTIEDWNTKIGSQETPDVIGVIGNFGLGVQNEGGQRLIEFCQENTLVIANTLLQQHKKRLYTWTSPDGQHLNQVNYLIWSQRRKKRYTVSKKQDWKLTVAQIMNSLLQNSDLNWRK